MKTFDEVYPEYANHKFFYSERPMGPWPTPWVTDEVFQSWRTSFCASCKKTTTWRYTEQPVQESLVMVPICGPDCLRRFQALDIVWAIVEKYASGALHRFIPGVEPIPSQLIKEALDLARQELEMPIPLEDDEHFQAFFQGDVAEIVQLAKNVVDAETKQA